jgi:hypothetical protein
LRFGLPKLATVVVEETLVGLMEVMGVMAIEVMTGLQKTMELCGKDGRTGWLRIHNSHTRCL